MLAERSERLSTRLGALAAALYDGGVAEETATRLLSSASAAVAQALALESLFEPPATVNAAVSEPVADQQAPVERRIRLAA